MSSRARSTHPLLTYDPTKSNKECTYDLRCSVKTKFGPLDDFFGRMAEFHNIGLVKRRGIRRLPQSLMHIG